LRYTNSGGYYLAVKLAGPRRPLGDLTARFAGKHEQNKKSKKQKRGELMIEGSGETEKERGKEEREENNAATTPFNTSNNSNNSTSNSSNNST